MITAAAVLGAPAAGLRDGTGYRKAQNALIMHGASGAVRAGFEAPDREWAQVVDPG